MNGQVILKLSDSYGFGCTDPTPARHIRKSAEMDRMKTALLSFAKMSGIAGCKAATYTTSHGQCGVAFWQTSPTAHATLECRPETSKPINFCTALRTCRGYFVTDLSRDGITQVSNSFVESFVTPEDFLVRFDAWAQAQGCR